MVMQRKKKLFEEKSKPFYLEGKWFGKLEKRYWGWDVRVVQWRLIAGCTISDVMKRDPFEISSCQSVQSRSFLRRHQREESGGGAFWRSTTTKRPNLSLLVWELRSILLFYKQLKSNRKK